MQIDMWCPRCCCRIPAATDNRAEEMLDLVFHNAPGYALGDGETFEDMISSTLVETKPPPCPDCGADLQVCEESLGQLAKSMLAYM